MADTPDVLTVVTGMTSDSESARKLAAYHLQLALADPLFADAFVQGDGVPVLKRLVLEENGNALAYALGSLTRLLDMDLGWDEAVNSDIIERAVQLVVSRPVINVLRNVLYLLVLIVSRPLDQLSATRPTTPVSTNSSFGLKSLLPALQTHEAFLECLVDKLSTADHVLCANALHLINALTRDSIVNADHEEWPMFIKRLQELGVISGVETLMRGEALRDLAQPILEFQGLTKVLLARWRDVHVDVQIPEHQKALNHLHASSLPLEHQTDGSSRSNSHENGSSRRNYDKSRFNRSKYERSSSNKSEYQKNGSSRSQHPQPNAAETSELVPDDKWKRLGFRTESPAAEFEETGYLSMMDLTEYVRTNLETYQKALLEQSVLPIERRCPIARASLSVTAMLYEYFDVDNIDDRDADTSADYAQDVERMVQPLLLLWTRMHAAILNAFLRLWNDAHASQKEFYKIEDLIKVLIRKVLGSADRRSSAAQVEEESSTIPLDTIRRLQLSELNSDFTQAWGTDFRKIHDQVHTEALQFMREQRIRCLLQGSWFPVLSNRALSSAEALSPADTASPTISSWRFVRVSPDRKYLHYMSQSQKLDRDPLPAELTRRIDLNTISSVDSSITKSNLPANWEGLQDTPKKDKLVTNGHSASPTTTTRLTIYGSRGPATNQEEEAVLLELHTANPSLASEWLDGLLMLLNQQPITADTNKLVDVLEQWSLKVRMLNLQWEDVDWVQAQQQHGGERRHNSVIASREGLDTDYWYDMGD